jgi:hypothetical protein
LCLLLLHRFVKGLKQGGSNAKSRLLTNLWSKITMPIPVDYAERVYAGVLGKIIGVYLGRPFEGWTYDRIMQNLGEIEYYVHDRLDMPLIVTDDDISGTFTFLRALPDHGNARDLTPAQIGSTWLNYIIENRTILWWGGRGNSTEHTAYLNLKAGIDAPRSGSIAQNSQVVAEQIGSPPAIRHLPPTSPTGRQASATTAKRSMARRSSRRWKRWRSSKATLTG